LLSPDGFSYPLVEQALRRSLFRINDTLDTDSFERTDRDRRVALALALKRLRHFTVQRHHKGEGNGAVPLAKALGGSLGELIDWALNEPDIKRASRSAGSARDADSYCPRGRQDTRPADYEEGAANRCGANPGSKGAFCRSALEADQGPDLPPWRPDISAGQGALGKWREIFRGPS
jgi:hypothetical protein